MVVSSGYVVVDVVVVDCNDGLFVVVGEFNFVEVCVGFYGDVVFVLRDFDGWD